jgi:DNA-binding transcriptional MerR regulator
MTNKTQDTSLPVSHGEMAGMLGMAKETLSYYCRIGTIPRPHRLGNCYYYTADEARQIVEWWELRKKLVFTDGKRD